MVKELLQKQYPQPAFACTTSEFPEFTPGSQGV
jgi:hypothetical protein